MLNNRSICTSNTTQPQDTLDLTWCELDWSPCRLKMSIKIFPRHQNHLLQVPISSWWLNEIQAHLQNRFIRLGYTGYIVSQYTTQILLQPCPPRGPTEMENWFWFICQPQSECWTPLQRFSKRLWEDCHWKSQLRASFQKRRWSIWS